MTVLLRLVGLLLMLTALAVSLSRAPDRPVQSLVARWAPPPSDFIEVKGQIVHLRDVGPRVRPPSQAGARPTRSVEQLTELIGRVPLKDLVREATDAIERLCIEAALELSGDNRASAAEMLGLSRQSLYVKLRRYGLGDATVDSES